MMYPVRVLRKTAREVYRVARGDTPAHAHLRDRLVGIVLATIGIDLIAALLALWFEHDAARTQITNFGDAIFWTSTQLLTVSSQLPNPLSTPGRILDVLMEAYAITVVAGLAGSIGAFLFRRALEIERAALRAELDAARKAGPRPA
jgi:hypothetical protein